MFSKFGKLGPHAKAIAFTKRSVLPNRSDLLPVNIRCTRSAVGQYEVACRDSRTRLKSVGFSAGFALVYFALLFR